MRKLEELTVVPWAANQVSGCARSTYDRLDEERREAAPRRSPPRGTRCRRACRERGASARIADAVAEAERLIRPALAPGRARRAGPHVRIAVAGDPPRRRRRAALTDAPSPQGSRLWRASLDIKVGQKREGRGQVCQVEGRRLAAVTRTPYADTLNCERHRRCGRPPHWRRRKRYAASPRNGRNTRRRVKAAEADLARAEDAERQARETWGALHDALLAASGRR